MASNPALRIDVKVEGVDRTSDEFKQIRRGARKTAGDAAQAAGEKVALPHAKRHAPGFIKTTLVSKRRGTSATLTTRLPGKKARVVGLLEYGGTVRTRIVPRNGQAIVTPQGPRAAVNKPRRYKGKHFLTDAVYKNRRQIDEAILEETLRAFDDFDGAV
jgi:hypothetical protein